ncbi:MAG: motility associated factor glycosyltransferase family protein [Spirochaetota bacterium]
MNRSDLSIPDFYSKNFRKNLSYLKTTYPPIYRTLLERKTRPELILAEDGNPTLFLDGLWVESRYRPKENALRFVPEDNDPEKTIIFFGSGLGYHINFLLQGGTARGVLIEENIDIFYASLFVLEPLVLRRLVPLVSCDGVYVQKYLRAICKGTSEIVSHMGSVQFNRSYYKTLAGFIKDTLKRQIASEITTRAGRRLWLKNILLNLSSLNDNCYGTKALQGFFDGPALLVSSGPFIESIPETLVGPGRNMPVISLLPSVSYLIKNGISPDLTFTTDPGFWNRYRLLKDLRIPLITTFSVDPVLFKKWAGDIFLFSHDLGIESFVKEVMVKCLSLPMQGTASIVMILFARKMGFSPLYLAGFDFACRGLKDHHSGAGFDELLLGSSSRIRTWETLAFERMRGERLIPARDIYGNKVFTTHKLDLYRSWLESEIELTDLVRLNNGAMIRGMRSQSPGELDLYDGSGLKERFLKRFKESERLKIEGKVILNDLRSHGLLDGSGKMTIFEDIEGIYRDFYGKDYKECDDFNSGLFNFLDKESSLKPQHKDDVHYGMRYLERILNRVEP